MSAYNFDIIDGRRVPPLIVATDHVLSHKHNGSVHVEAGHFQLMNTLNGSLAVHPGASATIAGVQNGSVSIAAGCSVRVRGAINGSVSVARGAELVIEAPGKLAGSLHNDGLIILRGVFGGSRSGSGELRLEGGGYVKQPARVEGNTHIYEW